MLIARPGVTLGYFVADGDTGEGFSGDGVPLAKAMVVNGAGVFAGSFLTEILARVIQGAAAGPATGASGFPFLRLITHPLLIPIRF